MRPFATLAAVMLLAAPAFAQDTPPSTGGQTPPADAPADADAPRLTTERPLGELMANPGARAAVEKHFPGIEENPLYEHLKSRSLRAIAPMAQGTISVEALDALDRDLAALPAA